MLTLFPFFPQLLVLNSIFIFCFKKWLGPTGIFYFSVFIILSSALLASLDLFNNLTLGSYYYVDFGRWFSSSEIIDMHLAFCFDNLALILSVVVLLLTSLAQLFGVEYMFREAFAARLVYLLNMFATSVILLFVVYDFFLVLVVWELIGLFSFLLVNFYSQRIYTIKASLKTFIFSRISDMFIFLAFNLAILVFNSTDISIIFLKLPFFIFHVFYINNFAINFIFILSLFISLAGCIKGAQFFFHVWLPDAMEAPTPASALIHSSTLVIMGIYLIVRFSLLFEFCVFTNYFLSILGGLTIAFGATVASFQNDIKKLVAYSTISQMGYLICGCGFCSYEEVIMYLIMHAVNKAFLFIIVGYTVHFFSGNTDLRQISNSYIYSLDVCVFFFTISVNLIGLPYSSGFYSKEFLLFQILRDDFVSYVVRATWLVSFCFTPFYMFLLNKSILFGPKKGVSSVYYSIKDGSSLNVFGLFRTAGFDKNLVHHFNQHSLFSSRFTSVVLFFFWVVFMFAGEFLLLVLMNFSTPLDSVYSSFFVDFSSFTCFSTNNASFFTLDVLFSYIILSTLVAIKFLYMFKFKNARDSIGLFFLVDFLLFSFIFLSL